LWLERERQRVEFLLTLENARASLARGEGRAITRESIEQLSSEVKERGRARLPAALTSPRAWRIVSPRAPESISMISGYRDMAPRKAATSTLLIA
jgi:hypothetical protein